MNFLKFVKIQCSEKNQGCNREKIGSITQKILKLRVRKAEPVERSKTRISIVQAVTSHVRFRNRKIEK